MSLWQLFSWIMSIFVHTSWNVQYLQKSCFTTMLMVYKVYYNERWWRVKKNVDHLVIVRILKYYHNKQDIAISEFVMMIIC